MINLKEIILTVVYVAVSVASFWLWFDAIPSIAAGELQSYLNFVIPVLGLLFSASLFSLTALFIREAKIVYPAIVIGVSAPYFLTTASGFTLSALAVSALLAALALYRIRKEYALSPGFSITKFLKSGLPLYLTVLSIVISTFYLAGINDKNAVSTLLPRPALDFTLRALSGPLGSVAGLPEINPEATVDDLLKELLSDSLKTQGVELSKIPQSEISRLLRTQRDEFSSKYGIKLEGDEKVGDFLYKTVTGKAEDLLGPYKNYLPYASAVAFFLALKALTIPLYYMALLSAFLLIKLLVFSRIVRSEKVSLEVERLTL
ncbi:MAG: hypothetical protein HYW91_03615 [Candidatus Sungbacteria bacterium]|nr:hypothetical protein [Candidatus Sungbacteria bacterium]